ncbi:MAG: hypothetical protein WDN06_22955 [Asticcacaulis sp.]
MPGRSRVLAKTPPTTRRPLPATPDARTVRTWLKDGVLRPIKVTPGPARDWLIDTERMDHAAYWCGHRRLRNPDLDVGQRWTLSQGVR